MSDGIYDKGKTATAPAEISAGDFVFLFMVHASTREQSSLHFLITTGHGAEEVSQKCERGAGVGLVSQCVRENVCRVTGESKKHRRRISFFWRISKTTWSIIL